ncbi:putative PCF11 component of pre-mRNA 3'-end processing factor CF I [Triangularia setosa]|uniref:PCF11 component of pre-mRNA 3'-end processing factor CF I n=1 Tax=Triangularia setosa TaxID=2587417 RepID=A0AAN7A3X8_9PEZI|nr:putative PCF11 component of pre-mRNA 3'-end processing factor CF I [Podospora setosa]
MDDHGDEVAADFREALQDLTTNARFEIVTLTNIARENANHGLAISEVLTNHIKEAPASKTLPALYVLDSIVKNVPTPYALYFGPKLYQIFMGSYTKVDSATRRKMDEMLKTWKEPVAGSISKKPVFPLELVRPIENALLAARNAYMQQANFQSQQHLMRGRPAGPPTRDTPTPPMGRAYQPPPHGQPPYQGPPNGQYPPHGEQPYPVRSGNTANGTPNRATPPQPAPSAGPYAHYQQPPNQGPYGAPPPPGINIDKLKDDIQQLIELDRAEFAQNMHDASKQNRLKALLDLQKVVQSQNLPQEQLMIINDQVAKLAVNMRAQSQPSTSSSYPPSLPPYNTHTPTPPAVSQQFAPPPAAAPVLPQLPAVLAAALGRPASNVAPVPVAAAPPPPPRPATTGGAAPGTLSLDSILGQGALAALLAAKKPATPQQTSTPVPPPAAIPPALAALRSPPPQSMPFSPPVQQPAPAPAAAPSPLAQNPSALLAMLRQSGLLGGTPTPPVIPQAPPPDPNIITLTPASLKLPRPHLLPYLLDALGPPCSQCGRRFPTTEEGKKKKTLHMDWHFRVHQRVAEAEQRGQHRSQFVNELDWIQSHEEPDVDYNAPSGGLSPSGSSDDDNDWSGGVGGRGRNKGREEKKRYIIAPDESAAEGGVNKVCPICQEKFQSRYLEEVQDWVWMDAIMVGGGKRVFHGTCWDEVNGGSQGAGHQGAGYQGAGGLPLLGKRKADEGDGEEEVRGGIKRMMR